MYPTTLNLYVHPNFDQKKRCINTMLNACGLNNYHTFCYKYIKNHPQKQIIRQKVTILFAYLTKNNYLCSEFQINRQKWTCIRNS